MLKLQNTKHLIFTWLLLLTIAGCLWAIPASAQVTKKCTINGGAASDCSPYNTSNFPGGHVDPNKCYYLTPPGPEYKVAEITCKSDGTPSNEKPNDGSASVDSPQYVNNDCEQAVLNKDNCGIVRYLVIFIQFLTAIVGVIVVAMIIIGGIQYSASGGDPSGVAAAKKRITNALLALALYFFVFAILQYLIPGGVIQ